MLCGVNNSDAVSLSSTDAQYCRRGAQAAPGHIIADWNIIQACGIFAMSVSGHSSLPVLRNSMAQPQV